MCVLASIFRSPKDSPNARISQVPVISPNDWANHKWRLEKTPVKPKSVTRGPGKALPGGQVQQVSKPPHRAWKEHNHERQDVRDPYLGTRTERGPPLSAGVR